LMKDSKIIIAYVNWKAILQTLLFKRKSYVSQ
jgi:hypothetical protein